MKFTFNYIENQYLEVKKLGYKFITCEEYVEQKQQIDKNNKIVVNRVDIDFSVKKTNKLLDIFEKLNIKATFFLRLHAPDYNPFSFENFRILKRLVSLGHELGYHSEVIDQATIWNEDAEICFLRDLTVMKAMFGFEIKSVASHGGATGLSNLDFWKDKKPKDYNLLYEAYDKEPEFNLFQESFYVSDSEWTCWKCYNKGVLVKGDTRCFLEHAKDAHHLIHLLIHPDTYFDHNIYDNEK